MNMPAWTAGVYHNSSAVYVSNPTPALGETVTLTVRVPLDAPIERAFIRSAPDGEGHHSALERVGEDKVSAYWQGTLKIHQPRNNYRFKFLTPHGAYYLTQTGVTRVDGPDWTDYKLVANFQEPTWVHEAIFYQIFPDRFHNGDDSLTPQDGAWETDGVPVKRRSWDDLPRPWRESGGVDFFGGDLPGILQKMDYLEALGVNALYMTPIFPSSSNHRYNIRDFFNVDPHLGGNEALIALREAFDQRGWYLMLDVTHNHTGSDNPWFIEAQHNPDAPSADFYTFYNRPDDYEAWLGVRTLPKLNYRSQKLREVMYAGEDSILRHWLKPPYRIDGWRLDVANMAGKQGSIQLGHKIGRGMRQAVKSLKPNAYLMGEHFFDGTPHLQGDEIDAIMDYQGLNIPIWRWLNGYDSGSWAVGSKDTVPMETEAFAEQLNRYLGAVPWVIGNMQFHQLGSHDTVRILNIVGGDRGLVRVGLSLIMGYPGVPCVYYGDEVGLPGDKDPDNRRPMPWDESKWDTDMLAHYRAWIGLRRTSHALKYGGMQTLYAAGDVFAFSRHSTEQHVIVLTHRGKSAVTGFRLPVRAAGVPDGATLTDLISGASYTVSDGAITIDLLSYHTAAFEVRQ